MNDLERARQAVSATLRLQFLNFRIDVQTNSLRLASRLQTYFREHLAGAGSEASPPSITLRASCGDPHVPEGLMVWRPEKARGVPKESFRDEPDGSRIIVKNRTGVVIRLDATGASIEGDLEQHTNQVVNLVGTLFGRSLLAQGYAMLHASAVIRERDEAGLIFMGNSGSGKSSLALQLVERGGYTFVSNDRVLLRAEGTAVSMVGLPKKPRVNPGTLLASTQLSRLVRSHERQTYASLSSEELWSLERKTDVDVERHLGARSRLAGRLLRAYSLQWTASGEGLDQAPMSANEAADALLATAKDFGVYDPGGSPPALPRVFRELSGAVEFIRVTGKVQPARLAELIGRSF